MFHIRFSIVILVLFGLSTAAQNDGRIQAKQKLITQIAATLQNRDLSKDQMTKLRAQISALKTLYPNREAPNDVKNAIKQATDRLKAEEDAKLSDLIGGASPMTAVLFSSLDRNEFEVAMIPDGNNGTKGVINQNRSGSTAGILIAAEAPFAYLGGGPRVPVGAWFGVNLQTGGGTDIGEVGLAAGLSLSLVSAAQVKRMTDEGHKFGLQSAKLLLGAIYGEVAELGSIQIDGEPLEVGDDFTGTDIPLTTDHDIQMAIGLGFRF